MPNANEFVLFWPTSIDVAQKERRPACIYKYVNLRELGGR